MPPLLISDVTGLKSLPEIAAVTRQGTANTTYSVV